MGWDGEVFVVGSGRVAAREGCEDAMEDGGALLIGNGNGDGRGANVRDELCGRCHVPTCPQLVSRQHTASHSLSHAIGKGKRVEGKRVDTTSVFRRAQAPDT